MKTRFHLEEKEIKEAIIEYIKKNKGVDIKTVSLSYYNAGNDPREQSYHSAEASE